MAYIVSMYAEGETLPSDCLPDFYETIEEAESAAKAELARVSAILLAERHPQIDWAVRYTIEEA